MSDWIRRPWPRFLVRRIFHGLIALFVISVLIFAGTQVLPGDAARAVLGRGATKEQVQNLRHALELDKPVTEQYRRWLSRVMHGDLGQSAVGTGTGSSRPVSSIIRDPLRNSIILAALTIALMIPLGLLLGVISGLRANRPIDQAISISTLTSVSVPEFVTGSLLVVLFGVSLNVLPATSLIGPDQTPLDTPDILVLPMATLLAVSLAQIVRMVRASVIHVLATDYVRTAELAGVSRSRILRSYVLPNALVPAIQVITLNAQYLVGGIIVVEAVFAYPGLGTALVGAVSTQDIPTVQAVSLIIAAFYIALNLLADVVVTLLVPKLRSAPA